MLHGKESLHDSWYIGHSLESPARAIAFTKHRDAVLSDPKAQVVKHDTSCDLVSILVYRNLPNSFPTDHQEKNFYAIAGISEYTIKLPQRRPLTQYSDNHTNGEGAVNPPCFCIQVSLSSWAYGHYACTFLTFTCTPRLFMSGSPMKQSRVAIISLS